MESRRGKFCDICNHYFNTSELLLKHYDDDAEHKMLIAYYPENGVQLTGLERGYDSASLKTLVHCYGKTVFTSCPSRSRFASFVFRDQRSANALLAARKIDFCGQSIQVKPLRMQLHQGPQFTGKDRSSGGVNEETLAEAPLPIGSQATLPTPTQLRRLRRDRMAQKLRVQQSRQPNSEQVTSNQKKPIPQAKSFTKRPEKRSTARVTGPVKCVHIRGFDSRKDIDGVAALMGTFGKIVHFKCSSRGKTATFVFENSDSVTAVLKCSSLVFAGRKLAVQPVKYLPQPFAEDSFLRRARKAVDLLDTSRPTEEQLTELEQSVTDCQEVRESRVKAMLSDISGAIGELYPGMVLHPFGSSATGLAFFDSDVDLFIELPVPDKRCVNRVTEQLRRAGHPFCEVVAVPMAKTPLVKFNHAFTGLSCDVSFKNCLGVINSRLLRNFMDMHPRVRQLMMTVKLWARIQGIASGRGGATSYALGLMVIFFLQKLGLVPPISDLLHSEDHAETVDGWACGFCPGLDKICIEESLADLLKSFFSFYSNFEWDRFVVCPLLGKEVDREDLLDAEKLPPEMSPLKTKLAANESMGFQSESGRVMCIQDPFALDHNLTRGIEPSKAREIFNLINVSDQAIALKSNHLVLPLLLSAQNAKVAYAMTSSLCRVQFARPLKDENEWMSRLWRLVAKVLTSVLKLRVSMVLRGRRCDSVELTCFGYHDTITGRARMERRLLAEDQVGFEKLSPIERQVAISDRLLGADIVKKNPKTDENDSSERKICDLVQLSPGVEEDCDGDETVDNGDLHLNNSFDALEDVTEMDSDTEDRLEEAENDSAADADGVPEKGEDVGEKAFTFMKGIDFPWDSELVDPVNSKPITQFVVRGSQRKNFILLHFQNNGPFDTFVKDLTNCLANKLAGWIIAELEQGS